MEIQDGMLVEFEGRKYRLHINAVACSGNRHWHDEDHADGSLGQPAHHHHEERCGNAPRNVTLYPQDVTEPKHVHDWGEGGSGCSCGAWRVVVKPVKGGKQLQYHIPPDASHPEGWTYDRVEDV